MSVVGNRKRKRKRKKRDVFGEKRDGLGGGRDWNAELVWKRNGRGLVRRQGN